MRPELPIILLAAVLALATVPTVAAGPTAEVPPEPVERLQASGVFDDHGQPQEATLGIQGDEATLVTVGPTERREDTFTVNWTKDNVGPQTAAWILTIRGASDEFGSVEITGSWQAASVVTYCTADYPTSACTVYGAGPVELTGTVGGESIALAGLALDTYCLHGHHPANHLTACDDGPIVEDPDPDVSADLVTVAKQ